MAEVTSSDKASSVSDITTELFTNPLNLFLLAVIAFIVYKIYKNQYKQHPHYEPEPELPKMKKRDFTLEELKAYDGNGPDGRILIAVNGKVFDVTKGKRFYGPGGPYAAFGGRDASRGLATFSVTGGSETYDDLSDLNSMEMDSVREWEMQFTDRYDYIGKLLKPGQEATSYSDEEEEATNQETVTEKPKEE
ncbi:unnamed protein product [Nezara viridula]|uniref:Cytochrome b5 heme-binding domain-containing protein n=1 Tax=Nezara viridula TaxID=85310 RepID=A0A9P0E378_NEZVI|nr:unnamed protein product [Nezara viridula]